MIMTNVTSEFGFTRQEAGVLGFRIATHLMDGNFDAAHHVLVMAEFSKQTIPLAPLHTMPIAQANVSTRTINLLEQNGVMTFGDLAGKGEEWILALHNGGPGTLAEIRTVIMAELDKRKNG
jgi:DNA-directed RNA polymerase alpha subunit